MFNTLNKSVDPLGPAKRALGAFAPSERVELLAYLKESLESAPLPAKGRRVRTEYRRCPRGACATCDAGGRHGPYLYEVWREGKTVRRRYLRKGSALDDDG